MKTDIVNSLLNHASSACFFHALRWAVVVTMGILVSIQCTQKEKKQRETYGERNLLTMVVNHLLNGTFLQVGNDFVDPPKNQLGPPRCQN